MRKELDKKYDPGQVEDRIYDFWLSGGYFHAEPDPDKKPYTIVIPPPNITGQLHMGHALDETFQDILIRYKRMQGYEALWLPGTDHASIATEAKIVEAMRQEGLTKEDLGREGFLERAWEWKEKFGSRIIEQLKKLGSSCDWERERFTLDEGCSKAVREVFCRLYEKGLIYQGERIINWCPHCKTSISDAEVEYEEQAGHFWHIRYPFADGSGYMEIATTRPETMLGDTALAVHPEDERYRDCVGKSVILPLVDKEIPVVADEYVDREFGTGVVKITPAHDPNDFEVGARHDLPIINVMTEDGHMAECAGKYAGMDRYEARKAIVADLEAGGYLVRIEDHTHNVGTCYRCGTTVEPMVSKQWFVKMEELAAPAIKAVREGETQFVPARFDKTYYNWMENIRDWCISRQLWWGHRIPAYYCDGCGETIVAREEPACCPHCGGKLRQDEDTLDTWFSSALWPFSTLGWPDKTPELDYFFPTDTLVTGYDIIFFWVARMIFSSIEQMGEVPFKTVFIHGLVRDAQGRKMSKSLGNGIDPLEVIAQYGADALRLTLATGNSPGNDMRFSDDKIMASRNFCNKIWNAARFILMNLSDEELEPGLPSELEIEDKWVLSKYNEIVRQVTQNIDKFELGIALGKVNEFVWDIVCDWYIEIVKLRLQAGGEQKKNALRVLCTLFEGTMKLLHPFAPFITEEIWQALPHQGESIMTAPWPVYDPALSFAREEEQFEIIMKAIRAIRNRRSELQVPPSKKAKVFIETERVEVFSQGEEFIKRLASASEVAVAPQLELEGMVMAITAEAKIGMPMDDLVDREKERQRLEKEKLGCEKEIASLTGKLQNEKFVSRAPQNVVDSEREKLARAQERLKKVEESLAAL
ncbi:MULTISPECIES: valine--tRNA ligase [Eubacteriales]|uniref:Valine--tRNA ligase n=1 Tax=Bittarella massiliensis (ex Durand et al. 2017) TaxID=1720313 RepID=A0AAQ1RX95_9FIRM|nr:MULTISPECIES: valine--tRNA ligase [Eubacteriales]ERJ00264.1 valine--tRNA ligase [Clostridium sp. ATCC 29733]MZL69228.1 valine--tRNA ligase [Bittarella massiliensis (ex Durand et al. 2017)]MZL79230.1 valine--tRNA ligase [Bittarella massiliensis (ex Durand et al. 2017)]SHG68453.1 valyl-tRNA synthetase [Bittarella massiliensis (ex Durand et al. 2017)]